MQPTRRLLCTVFVGACVYLCFAAGAKADGTAPSPSPSGSSAGGSGQSQSPSAGGGGGGMSIESTILAYQGFQYDADSIADAAKPSLPMNAKIVIATASDVAAILQLRIALFQLAMLSKRLNDVKDLLYNPAILPCAKGAPAIAVSDYVSTLSSVATLAQTVASITSVTESVTSQSGNFLDNSLMNLVASDLVYRERNGYVVYLPSVPGNVKGTSASPDLQGTYLFKALRILDNRRTNLQNAARATLGSPKCKKVDTKAIRDVVVGAISTTDNFEASLFGNGFTLPSTTVLPEVPPKKVEPKSSVNNTKSSGISNTINISMAPPPEKPAKAPSGAKGPGVIQQLLYIDLLLSGMRGSDPSAPLQDVYVLSVHALEAAGSQLIKTQLFLGARSYYSGGAAATFTLIDKDGSLACSGITYGYRGFVQADDFSHAIIPDDNTVPGTNNRLPSTMSYTPGCKNLAGPHQALPPPQ
jgi:hypothetical protein